MKMQFIILLNFLILFKSIAALYIIDDDFFPVNNYHLVKRNKRNDNDSPDGGSGYETTTPEIIRTSILTTSVRVQITTILPSTIIHYVTNEFDNNPINH